MTVQDPSACFSMSIFGPLQKFTRALAASGALMRISTRPVASTRGYSAPHTLVSAGLKSPCGCAEAIAATDTSANANATFFIVRPSRSGSRRSVTHAHAQPASRPERLRREWHASLLVARSPTLAPQNAEFAASPAVPVPPASTSSGETSRPGSALRTRHRPSEEKSHQHRRLVGRVRAERFQHRGHPERASARRVSAATTVWRNVVGWRASASQVSRRRMGHGDRRLSSEWRRLYWLASTPVKRPSTDLMAIDHGPVENSRQFVAG